MGREAGWLQGPPGGSLSPWEPGGPHLPWLWDSLDDAAPLSALQDYVFYLEPEKLESGKGKCPYDPKLDTASALISECPHPTPVLWPKGVTSASGAGRGQSLGR